MSILCTYHKKVEMFDGEVTRPNVYLKIRSIVITNSATVHIQLLSEKDGFIVDEIKLSNVPIDLTGTNYHTQIYNYLKENGDITNCTDV